MKIFAYIALVSTILMSGRVFAQEEIPVPETTGVEETTQEEVYTPPSIKPEFSVSGGYRYVHSDGSDRAGEYEYLHNSLIFGGEFRMFSFPHRFHLEVDVKNKKDFMGDVTYMYRDIIRFRGISSSIFHNLENIRLIDLDPSTPSPGVDVRDAETNYGIRTGISNAFLRFKTPDFPFHVYVEGSLVERSGTQQQRSLLGSGSFNNVVRASQSRNIDLDTKSVIVGANSHLGPVEVDFSHGEKRFDVGGDKVLFDHYTASAVRTAGEFPHNLIPDLKSSSNTIKIHTSYTGSLVASATFSKIDKENKDSAAKADYFIGAGEISWIESPRLAFFLKYRHKESDIDNPDIVSITDRTNPLNTFTYAVEPSISSVSDHVSGIVRYRPVSGVTVKADYTYENIRRALSPEWDIIPQDTQKNAASVSADVRLLRGLDFKAKYTHKYITNPAYNTEPDRSDEGRVSVTWIPAARLNATVSYSIISERRDDLLFTDAPEARNREVNRNRLMGSVTYLLLKDLSVTAVYAYMHDKTQQDIPYQNMTGAAQVDLFVPSTDMVHSYGLDLSYLPKDNITINTGASYTISSGEFSPSDPNLLQPVSIASFSQLKTKEFIYYLSGEYRVKGGWAAGVQYRYCDFDDALDNPWDDVSDGKAHIVLLSLSKRW
jgi:predicted porin